MSGFSFRRAFFSQILRVTEAAPVPKITVTPGNSSVSLTGNYTLAMIDADIVGAKLPEGQTRHWLVNGVNVSGSPLCHSHVSLHLSMIIRINHL